MHPPGPVSQERELLESHNGTHGGKSKIGRTRASKAGWKAWSRFEAMVVA